MLTRCKNNSLTSDLQQKAIFKFFREIFSELTVRCARVRNNYLKLLKKRSIQDSGAVLMHMILCIIIRQDTDQWRLLIAKSVMKKNGGVVEAPDQRKTGQTRSATSRIMSQYLYMK